LENWGVIGWCGISELFASKKSQPKVSTFWYFLEKKLETLGKYDVFWFPEKANTNVFIIVYTFVVYHDGDERYTVEDAG
jgi:hypothetical protein